MSDATLAQQFYDTFQTHRQEFSEKLENAENLLALSLKLVQLRKKLVDATPFLPAYDQRQYETQLKSWEQSLETLRSASKPKSKFAFKRKEPTMKPTEPTKKIIVPVPEPIHAPSTYLTLSNHSHARLSFASLPTARDYAESDVTIADLDNCIVDLISSSTPVLTALHIRNLTNTILLLPVIKGSVLLHNLTRCIIVVGCHQFRMHTSTNVVVHLSIPSNPVIEHCSMIKFSKYPASIHATALNEYSVQDFSHIRATPSPNWSPLPDSSRLDEWIKAGYTAADPLEDVLDRLLLSLSG